MLNENRRAVANIAGTTPAYTTLENSSRCATTKTFSHPHDVLVDDDGSVYVALFASNQT